MRSTGDKKSNKVNQMKLVGNYIIYQERLLGAGQYGKVYEASDQNNQTKRYAVKVIPALIFSQSMSNSQMLQKEIEVLKKLRHENLVCLHEISQSLNNLYLFLDYCNGGDLSQYIDSKPQKKLSESEALEFFKQYLAGYKHLYDNKIIHRDIKPENLMLHNGKIKLGDFGFGRFIEGNMNEQSRMSIKCTPIYASPQLLKKTQYSSKCDVWSSGCLLYKMLFGNYPFIGRDMDSLIKDIERKTISSPDFPFPKDVSVSEDVKKLLTMMLKFDEAQRLSWEDLFVHPVFAKKDTILADHDDLISESDKGNLIFQSIIQNRNHVLDNDLITDHAQNFQVRNTKNPEQKLPQRSKSPNQQQSQIPQGAFNNINQVNPPTLPIVPQYQPYSGNSKLTGELTQKPLPGSVGLYGQSGSQASTNTYSPSHNTSANGSFNPADQAKANFKPKEEFSNNNNGSNGIEANGEEDIYRQSLQKLHQEDMNQIKSGKTDKMILFLRNQALFADVTMQLVFTARNKYQLPSVLFYELIYSLTGFYNFNLDLLKKILTQSISNKIISDEDFQIYLSSKQYKKTIAKIEKDSGTANTFFKTLSSGILKEVQQWLSDPATTNYEQIKDFEKFIKLQSANYNDYRTRFNVVAKAALATLNPDKFDKDLNALRGIRGIQLFIKLDEFMPISQFITFDFRFFYDQFMNKVEPDRLLREIKAEII